jgi:hypothetical protein
MDRDVYADERIAVAMQKLRPVRIDLDRDRGIARRYDVSGAPTLIITDSLGRELFRYAGSLPLDKMLAMLEALPSDMTRMNELSAALDANPGSFTALSEFGHQLRAAGFYRSSNTYLDKALKTKEGRRRSQPRTDVLVAMARNALELRLYADAVRLCEQALRELEGRPDAASQADAIRRDLERARGARGG